MARTYTWKPIKYKTVEAVENDEGKTEAKEIEKETPFSGHVTVNMIKATERLRLQKECNVTLDENGVIVATDTFETAIKIIEAAKENITEVKLVRIDDKFEFNTVDDLEYDKDGTDVLSQVGAKILEGFKLGEN